AFAAWQIDAAESLQERLFDNAAIETRRDTDGERDIQRHEARRVDLEVLAGESEALQVCAHLDFECRIDRETADAVDRHEHRVPTARPTPRRGRSLYFRMALRNLSVVSRGDSAFLGPERLWRIQPDLFERLRVSSADGRQR